MIEEIQLILIDADINGLIRMGAPEDEYNSEAKSILDNISKDSSIDEISIVIWDVFYDSFCTGTIGGTKDKFELDRTQACAIMGSADQYRCIAEKIEALL
jgi:hypothetical protein